MSAGARSAVTLVVLCLLLVVAAVWGWNAVTEPFPERADPPPCVDVTVVKGDRVTTEDVLVSVFNGSNRQGLAGATSAELQTRGFFPGDTGNADLVKGKGNGVQIWTADRRSPAVDLVNRQFAGATVVEQADLPGDGVVVVMGDAFTRLRQPQVSSVKVKRESSYCQATGTTLEE
jgi:hypothetical protein